MEKQAGFWPVIRLHKVADDVEAAIVDCGLITELDARYSLR